MDQLTTGHPRWQEFLDRLEQRLNFRERGDKSGDYRWRCGKANDPFGWSREVLAEMGLQPKASLAYIRRLGRAYCDCEIVINLGATGD